MPTRSPRAQGAGIAIVLVGPRRRPRTGRCSAEPSGCDASGIAPAISISTARGRGSRGLADPRGGACARRTTSREGGLAWPRSRWRSASRAGLSAELRLERAALPRDLSDDAILWSESGGYLLEVAARDRARSTPSQSGTASRRRRRRGGRTDVFISMVSPPPAMRRSRDRRARSKWERGLGAIFGDYTRGAREGSRCSASPSCSSPASTASTRPCARCARSASTPRSSAGTTRRRSSRDFDACALPGGFAFQDRRARRRARGEAPAVERSRGWPRTASRCSGSATARRCWSRRGSCRRSARPRRDGARAEPCGRAGYYCRWVRVAPGPKARRSIVTCALAEDAIVPLPIAHGEGRFTARDEPILRELTDSGRVLLRYVDERGVEGVDAAVNPNGSLGAIAALGNADGNVPRSCRTQSARRGSSRFPIGWTMRGASAAARRHARGA